MAGIETYPWDVTDHLQTKEDMAAYLEVALEDGDPALVVAALNDIVRARRFSSQTPQDFGLDLDTFAKIKDDGRSLDMVTALKIIQALGLRLKAIAL